MDDGSAGVRVLVVDDHRMFADSVAALLGSEPGIRVVGTAPDLSAARRALSHEQVDVVLLDQVLPDGRGVDALVGLRKLSPATRFVILTGSGDDAALVAAVEAGCAGFLEKSRSAVDLVAAVRSAARGDVLLPQDLLVRLVSGLQREGQLGADLTRRELEVLALLAQGLSNHAIGQELFVSVNTVRNHVASILAKLGAHSKLEALAVTVREGLLPHRGAPSLR